MWIFALLFRCTDLSALSWACKGAVINLVALPKIPRYPPNHCSRKPDIEADTRKGGRACADSSTPH